MSEPTPDMRRRAELRYDSIAVHVPSAGAQPALKAAIGLALAFGARIIGVGAQRVEMPLLPYPDAGFVTPQVIHDLEALAEAELNRAADAFHTQCHGLETEWRASRQAAAYAVTRAARDADLVVAAGGEGADGAAATADVLMGSGRPVLLTPPGEALLEARRIVIGWKDSREARRAVTDALPLLLRAEEVLVQAVSAEESARAELGAEAAAVAANLGRRGVKARAEVTVTDDPPSHQLDSAAASLGADLIVIGAYGHSRVTEWAFGGVTRETLRRPRRFVLLSH